MAKLLHPLFLRLELRVHRDDVLRVKRFAEKCQAVRKQQLGLIEQSLIDRLRDACNKGELPHPFTPADFKDWVREKNITKLNGTSYAESSLHALLSNSDEKNAGSKNLNKKVLRSSKGVDGQKRFAFI